MIREKMRNSKLFKFLFFYLIYSLITLAFILFTINKLAQNIDLLKNYNSNFPVPHELQVCANFGIVSVFLLVIWLIILIGLMLKAMFPTKKALKSSFCIDELQDLGKMLTDIKKGVNNEQ
ncbi:hypothetical protein GFV15_00150 [Lactococcus lactis]|uniref:hypothetical protein n=1 Tax=Lactococcus lactis TaxID=1358 RepID=UPI0012938723|nr:hypothetical protein [Lactococcus lactis]MQQ79405.1 hypothetical protein [Lactococcus lactis]